MKINWRILIPAVLIIVVIFWMVNSLAARSYSGTRLNFGIGSGPVTVSNTSNNPVAIQLVGSGTRSFSVTSSIDGLSGASARQGSGSDSTQLFEFNAPPGVSVFTVVRGSNVNFVEQEDAPLSITAQPLSGGEVATTVLAGGILILGGLFYISRTTKHLWLKRFLRRQETAGQISTRLAERLAFKQRFDRTTSDKP